MASRSPNTAPAVAVPSGAAPAPRIAPGAAERPLLAAGHVLLLFAMAALSTLLVRAGGGTAPAWADAGAAVLIAGLIDIPLRLWGANRNEPLSPAAARVADALVATLVSCGGAALLVGLPGRPGVDAALWLACWSLLSGMAITGVELAAAGWARRRDGGVGLRRCVALLVRAEDRRWRFYLHGLVSRGAARSASERRLLGKLLHGEALVFGRHEQDELIQAISAGLISDVIVWSDPLDPPALRDRLADGLAPYPVALHGVTADAAAGDTVVSVRLVPLHGMPMGFAQGFAKRLLDIVGSSLLLALLCPLLLAVAVAIRLDSPGPVLFAQERRGYARRNFKVLKFRSMYQADVDARGSRLTSRNDPRVTRLGAWLRRTSIDELPQLINVLKGDMSLVGPRPHPMDAKAGERLYPDVVERYYQRYRIRPGVTGLAQVEGWRGTTETEEQLRRRVEHDLLYIDRYNFLLDLRILLRTPAACLDTRNAF